MCMRSPQNALELDRQIENQLFARLMALNCAYFDYKDCDFSERSMQAKEGSARVALHRFTGITHSYTLECPYYCAQPLSKLAPVRRRRHRWTAGEAALRGVPTHNKGMYREMSEGLVMTLLDLYKLSPITRLLPRGLDELRGQIKAKLVVELRLKRGHGKDS